MPTREEVKEVAARTRRILGTRGYSHRTIETYARWIERFLVRLPDEPLENLSRHHVMRFLHDLAAGGRLAPRTRNQAMSALSFLFREVLDRDELLGVPRAREGTRMPIVLSHAQVQLVLRRLSGKYRLLGSLMYGCGLRLKEAHALRVQDVDFDLLQIAVRDGKGFKDRFVMLPEQLISPLRRQIDMVRRLHRSDRSAGAGWVRLPHALGRKDPRAGYDLSWQYLFPSSRVTPDPSTGRRGRFHLHPSSMQRNIKQAARESGVHKPVSCHTLRRSFATQMLRAGYDVRSVQRLMGHNDVRTTMIYVQAVSDSGIHMRSPLDQPSRD